MTPPKTIADERWCSQHHQYRVACEPWDRHVWPFRVRDDLIAAVERKALELGLPDRNAGVTKALEDFVGWEEHDRRGPDEATKARHIVEARQARIKREREEKAARDAAPSVVFKAASDA